MCINCDKVQTTDTNEVIERKKNEMKQTDALLSRELDSTCYNTSFGSAVVSRELAAKAAIFLPIHRTYAIQEWLTFTYILHNLEYQKKNGCSNFRKIARLSRRVIELQNEIHCLEKMRAIVVKIGDKESLEWTENEPLSFVPEEVYESEDAKYMPKHISDKDINIESSMMQEAMMLPIQMLLMSEDISRILKRCYHHRLLPFIKDSTQASVFTEICFALHTRSIAENTAQGVDQEHLGVTIIDEVDLQAFEQQFWDSFFSENVKWFFDNLIQKGPIRKSDLSSSIVVRDDQYHTICFPLYSLLMLGLATLKWMKEPDLGRALNFKGRVIEDFFYRYSNAYQIDLKHPNT
jgi:hypothetical protein